MSKFLYIQRHSSFFIFSVGFVIFSCIYFSVIHWPLQGIHSHRQADTLFSAYSYCFENTEFLKPKIIHRNDTSGVSIGEFPLFSYILSIPCKLTGEWSETLPKYFSLILALACTLSWAALVKRKFKNLGSVWTFASVFLFMMTHLIHLTIPIPDAFASLLMATAGLVDSKKILRRSLSYLLFATGFAVRPYFFILSFFIYENVLIAVGALSLCGGFYLFWYKSWIQHSELDYYSTQTKSFSELLSEAPRALHNLPIVFLRNHLNFVLLIPFLLGAIKQKKILVMLGLSWVVVLLMKGDHYVNHTYYLGAASIFAAILVFVGLREMKQWQQNTILALSILIGISNTQHLWTNTKQNLYFSIQEELKKHQVPPDAKIAAYVGLSPQFLYWAKRTGWVLPEEKANEACPPQTDFKMLVIENRPKILTCP